MLHERERGQPFGKVIRGFPDKMSAYKAATTIVNHHYKEKGLL